MVWGPGGGGYLRFIDLFKQGFDLLLGGVVSGFSFGFRGPTSLILPPREPAVLGGHF